MPSVFLFKIMHFCHLILNNLFEEPYNFNIKGLDFLEIKHLKRSINYDFFCINHPGPNKYAYKENRLVTFIFNRKNKY